MVQATAQSWLIFQLTNSTFYLGLEGFASGFRGLSFCLWAERSSTEPIAKLSSSSPRQPYLLMALFLGVMDYLGTIHVWHVLALSAAGFGFSIILFAASRHFLLSLFFLFFAGGFQTTFLSSVATLLQIQSAETNRGQTMSLFGLINRGLGPLGSFPFGLIAAAIGAPWTVVIAGLLV